MKTRTFCSAHHNSQTTTSFPRHPAPKEDFKRSLTILLALTMSACALALTTARADDGFADETVVSGDSVERKGIANGGFETGDLTGWMTTGVIDGEVTNTEAHNGTYSMDMSNFDTIFQQFSILDNIHANSLRFWAKGDSFAGIAYAKVSYLGGGSDSLFFGGASLASGDWTQFVLTLKPLATVTKVTFSTGETTPIFVDDIVLIPRLR